MNKPDTSFTSNPLFYLGSVSRSKANDILCGFAPGTATVRDATQGAPASSRHGRSPSYIISHTVLLHAGSPPSVDFRHILVFVEPNGLFSLDGDAWAGVHLERMEDLVDILGLEIACEDQLIDQPLRLPSNSPSTAGVAATSPRLVAGTTRSPRRGGTVGCPHCYAGFPSSDIDEHLRTVHGILPTEVSSNVSPAMSSRRSSGGSSVMRGLRALVGGGASESPRAQPPPNGRDGDRSPRRVTATQPNTPTRFVDSSVVVCPLCGRSLPVEQATAHTNACLDLAEQRPDDFVGVSAEIAHPPSPAEEGRPGGSRRSRARLPSIRRRTSGARPIDPTGAGVTDTLSFEREHFAELESLSSDDDDAAAGVANEAGDVGMVPMRSMSSTARTPVVYEELPRYPELNMGTGPPPLSHYSSPVPTYASDDTASDASTVALEDACVADGVECPVCSRCYPMSSIERHVDACLGGDL